MTNPFRLNDLIEAMKKVHCDALEPLSDAVIAADHLGDVADHLIGQGDGLQDAQEPPGRTSERA